MVAKWGNWVNDNKTLEEELREQHPGLKELWDKYQEMLKLCLPPEHNKVRAGENPADVLDKIRKRKASGSSNGIRSADRENSHPNKKLEQIRQKLIGGDRKE